jgi:ribose transport system substrate-binding protein
MTRLSAAVLFVLLGAAACSDSGSKKEKAGAAPAGGAKTYTLAVIPKGTTHEFWKSIHAGAIQAAQELDAAGDSVHIIWKGPLREDDREQQVQVVEGFTSQGVSGIVLAPLDSCAPSRRRRAPACRP